MDESFDNLDQEERIKHLRTEIERLGGALVEVHRFRRIGGVDGSRRQKKQGAVCLCFFARPEPLKGLVGGSIVPVSTRSKSVHCRPSQNRCGVAAFPTGHSVS